MAKNKKEMPTKFPFWARFKKNKNRTTLIIDEELVKRKNSDKYDDCYVHRESIHTYKKDYEEVTSEIIYDNITYMEAIDVLSKICDELLI